MGPGIAFPTALIAAIVVALVLGAALLVFGLRGRRINEHPVCRRCRFDLQGVYPARSVCPECGGDLGRRRAVRRGQRRRRRWAVALGGLLLLASVGALAAGGYGWARAANLNPYKPTWMLAMEARHGEAAPARSALDELISRLEDGKLGEQRIESLVAAALEHQADVNQPWEGAWGDLVDVARAQGHVDDAQYARYMRQSLDWEGALSMELRERVARGDSIWMRAVKNIARVGERSRVWEGGGNLWFSASIEGMTLDDAPVDHRFGGSGSMPLSGQGSITLQGPRIEAPEGPLRIAVQWRVRIAPAPAGVMAGRTEAPSPPPPDVEWLVTLDEEIEVLAPGSRVVSEVDDPSLAAAMRDAIEIRNARTHDGGRGARAMGDVMFKQRPLPVAFDVFWRVGETEFPVGSVSALPCGAFGHGYMGREALPADFSAGTVDVILRSNPAAAQGNPAITEIWKGELVFEGVEVQR